MKWRQPAEREVVEAVVATFRAPADDVHRLLSPLSQRQWVRSYHWLDASGMALYFLTRIERLGLQGSVPAAVLARLRQNLADNCNRSTAMFAEFAELNRVFRAAGIDYCNLKGFTLSPDSCPSPALRCQLDFDFLVDGRHLEICRAVLAQRGYILRARTTKVWEFKTDSDQLADIADYYKAKPQRCAEVHFSCEAEAPHMPARDSRLDRLSWRSRGGLDFPALSPVDLFIGQATHLFAHLCGACTRLAWLLEFTHHIGVRFDDRQFWNAVQERAAADRTAAIAIGVACLLAANLFAAEIPPGLEEYAARLPEGVALWVERYGRRALLADFPGTKLNLLLRAQLGGDDAAWKKEKRTALVPLHRAPRILPVRSGAGLLKRLRGELYQLRFDLFRLRFHFVEGLRYALEAARWRRQIALHQAGLQLEPSPRIHSTTEPS